MREVGGLRGLHAIVVACGGHPCADRQREARTGADQHTEVVGGGAVPQRTQGAQVSGTRLGPLVGAQRQMIRISHFDRRKANQGERAWRCP